MVTDRPTPRRLEVLREIDRFGTVSVLLQFGWQHRVSIFAVHSLTELKDITSIGLDLKKLGWVKRTWRETKHGRLPILTVSKLGYEILEQNP